MLIQLKKHLYQSLIMICTVALLFSCKKDISSDPANPQGETPDLSTKINSSVSGFVTDETNAAVLGASVTVGTSTTTTDKYGFFEVKNVQVVKTAAVVTVTKAGYFKGIKTYGATANKSVFFRIKLIPKTTAGTISAAAGGNVALTNGLIIALPSNAVVVASNNTAYTGTVNVAAYWINPEGADLAEIMPGDLRGIDDGGFIKGLTTYGMTAVELTGASGELLQIATGKNATITMPLSALAMASAPSSIPLWYFDEAKGLWKQEGSATKTGNSYVGNVSHFSYWNCDLPNATVPLTFTVVDANGDPVGNAHVEITPANGYSHIGGFTDSSGYVSVFVTANTTYTLTIYSSCVAYGSSNPDYTQQFSVATTAVDLGNVALGATVIGTVSGTVTNCIGAPVTNGYIILQSGYQYSRHALDNTGSYSFNTILCSGSNTVNIIGEDINTSQQSTPITYTIVAGANAIANIQACGVNTSEFITYTIDGGSAVSLSAPADSISQSGNGTSLISYILGTSGSNPAPNANAYISFDNTNIAVGSIQNLLGFGTSSPGTQQTTIPNPIGVNITEYGVVGEFIAGNFTGTVTGSSSINYLITCSFRVRRNF